MFAETGNADEQRWDRRGDGHIEAWYRREVERTGIAALQAPTLFLSWVALTETPEVERQDAQHRLFIRVSAKHRKASPCREPFLWTPKYTAESVLSRLDHCLHDWSSMQDWSGQSLRISLLNASAVALNNSWTVGRGSYHEVISSLLTECFTRIQNVPVLALQVTLHGIRTIRTCFRLLPCFLVRKQLVKKRMPPTSSINTQGCLGNNTATILALHYSQIVYQVYGKCSANQRYWCAFIPRCTVF